MGASRSKDVTLSRFSNPLSEEIRISEPSSCTRSAPVLSHAAIFQPSHSLQELIYCNPHSNVSIDKSDGSKNNNTSCNDIKNMSSVPPSRSELVYNAVNVNHFPLSPNSDHSIPTPPPPGSRVFRLCSPLASEGGNFGSLTSNTSSPGAQSILGRYLEIDGYPVGLENKGNTCYFNSVVQLFYHCSPLRHRLLEFYKICVKSDGLNGVEDNTLLMLLSKLFVKMHKANDNKRQPKDPVVPKLLLARVKELNVVFNNELQHDAHEFAMFLLSDIIETEKRIMEDEKNRNLFLGVKTVKNNKCLSIWRRGRKDRSTTSLTDTTDTQEDNGEIQPALRDGNQTLQNISLKWTRSTSFDVQSPLTMALDGNNASSLRVIFGGQFASLTACFRCERVTVKREDFLDLSLEIEQGSSLRRCIVNFGTPELFYGNNKLHCDKCKKQVVAQRIIRVHRLPEYALLVHLKRFRYDEKTGCMTKRSDHVVLPCEIDMVEYEPLDEDDEEEKEKEKEKEEKEKEKDDDKDPSTPLTEETKADAVDDDSSTPPQPSARLVEKLDGLAQRKGRYALRGFVTHSGEGPNLGHYFTCVRRGGRWCRFDDKNVTELTEHEMQQYWGVPIPVNRVVTSTAYILLYERVA